MMHMMYKQPYFNVHYIIVNTKQINIKLREKIIIFIFKAEISTSKIWSSIPQASNGTPQGV